jgi:hypothetical protein
MASNVRPLGEHVIDDLTWSALDDDSVDDLRALPDACLGANGGLPLFPGSGCCAEGC